MMEAGVRVDLVVASRSPWLAAAMGSWLAPLPAFAPRGPADPAPAEPERGLILALDDGREPRGPLPGEADWPRYPRVYLAPSLTPLCLLEALRLDARAVLPYGEVEDLLLPVLLAVAEGRPVLPPALFFEAFPRPGASRSRGPGEEAPLQAPRWKAAMPACRATVRLTLREVEIGCALARGQSYEQIAAQLCISRNTVKHHVRQLIDRLGAADRFSIAAHFNQPVPCPAYPYWVAQNYSERVKERLAGKE